MDYYRRSVFSPRSIYSILAFSRSGASVWTVVPTGTPDPTYASHLLHWSLKDDLLLVDFKKLCVKKIWEF